MMMHNEIIVTTDGDGVSIVLQTWVEMIYYNDLQFDVAVLVTVKRDSEGDHILDAKAKA